MKIFVSWSGARSKKVAELLHEWIGFVIQAVKPWISTKEIEKGTQWFNELSNELASINVGIICLTQENKNEPWILFESGALAKGLQSSRVCTFLIDLSISDIANPLALFNHTIPNKEGIWRLINTLNESLNENKIPEARLLTIFNTYWPEFESKFEEIIKSTQNLKKPSKRNEREILSEILNTMRSLERRFSINLPEDNLLDLNLPDSTEQLKLLKVFSNPIIHNKIVSMIKDDQMDIEIVNYLSEKYHIKRSLISQEVIRIRQRIES